MDKKYFLGANSCEGFVSSFGESFDPNSGWKAYIIKGGPGTGKSSFMKYVAKKANEKGCETILCPCSSDPNSLDGVILPDKKTVIMDGTSPHTVDPRYPAVCEEILNFGQFWKTDSFAKGEEIIRVTDDNKRLHQTASGYMRAIGQIMNDNLKIASACTDKKKALRLSEGLCRKYIPKSRGKAFEWVRYLTSITPEGVVFLGADGVFTEDTVIIEDELGYGANLILNRIRDYCLKNGYEIITVRNGFMPSILTDGIVIPELNLSFLRESSYTKINLPLRRIHYRRFTNASVLSRSRERLKFNKKAISTLLSAAAETLKEAKAVHDVLEGYYISAMDFDELNKFASNFVEKIL